jgi:hypothetical protein
MDRRDRRDRFAIAALATNAVMPWVRPRVKRQRYFREIAAAAYELADAMLEASETFDRAITPGPTAPTTARSSRRERKS